MLTFVGLGLYDERSITIEGRDAIRAADRIFMEAYTSRLAGATVTDLEAYHDVEIELRDRAGVERDPAPILEAAADEDVVFLVGGDPMISTTHVDLRLRAAERGIETRVVHGTTAQTAASSLTGLQNYRFGKATTLPFPGTHGGDSPPTSVIETIMGNRERDLHTLVYLDISVDPADRTWSGAAGSADVGDGSESGREAGSIEDGRFLTGDRAAELLADPLGNALGVVVARAGSDTPVVAAGSLESLGDRDFGDPLHLLVIPAGLHDLEAEALEVLADADPDAIA